jgi:hypothetical protein
LSIGSDQKRMTSSGRAWSADLAGCGGASGSALNYVLFVNPHIAPDSEPV